MARRFLRVDLSDRARDFRPIAVEPGVPLLDRSDANSKILFKWLGGLVADPEWEEESVNFFVRDDYGGRLEEVVCQPADDEDLKGPLREDLETLRDRIAKARPETSTERAVHRILGESFRNLAEDENRTDRDNYFFKYRDVLGRWRLVWCWGYQRIDLEPAPTVICTDPDCNLLFVRRPGQSPRCPSCEAALLAGERKRGLPKRALLAGLALLLLGGLLVYWLLSRNRLLVTPETWAGRAGSRVEFQVKERGLFGAEDVSQQAVAVVADPRVARFDPFGSTALALSPGKTVVRFYLGNRSATATLTVGPPANPREIAIEPALVDLGIGTTARLKLIGEYDDGTTADLTESADWEPKNDGVVFAQGGFLEGLGEGTSTIQARYRASPEDDYLEASANVSVSKVDFESLEMAINPDPVPLGRASRLRIDAVSQGKRYSVLQSSLLDVAIDPTYLAAVRGSHVEGNHPGHGTARATFGDGLSGSVEFDVERGAGIESLVVAPEQLDMAVGEITDLSIISPSREPIRMTSSDPSVVEVTRAHRLAGRSEGSARVVVSQGRESRTVDVAVRQADVEAIAVRPAHVVVPVDHRTPVRVMGRIEGDGSIELAPEVLVCEKRPSPRHAEFDPAAMEVHGVWPTDKSSPQSLAFRFGKLVADAPVDVVIAPLRLELTPSGEVDVPLGQMMAVNAWANYRGGYRVEVRPDRVEWHSAAPSGSKPGLELRGNKVAALKAGAGPLRVWGTYLGRDSEQVTFKSVERGPIDLKLEVDRTLRLANEPGRIRFWGTGPRGDVELVPELAAFESSDADVLNVDGVTGLFRAGKPGDATVTARHAGCVKPASVKLTVVDPANARLAFEPRLLKLAVDEVAQLDLLLEAKVGDQVERAMMVGPGVSYSIERPEAVRWHPPTLVGLSPAGRFRMTASYLPYLLRPATAEVEVGAGEEPGAIRVDPSQTSLAARQTLALTVEEQLPGDSRWNEVRPDAVAWEVPPQLLWRPATESLRPAVTVAAGTSGRFTLKATFRGKEATCELNTGQPRLNPADASVQLVLQREPEGRYVPVGTEQRYSIVLTKDGQREPAADVQWPKSFENEYVRWEAPVLTAKQAGYEQWLEAEVGGRTVRWWTHTIDPFQPGQTPPRREDQPQEVVILSDQGPAVELPVGAQFDDFRVEARYADGFTRLVTKKANMSTEHGFSDAPVSFAGGQMIGVRPGRTVVHADFDGVPTEKGLDVTVTEGVALDEIRLKPSPVNLLPGETVTLHAEGFKDGKSIGLISGLAGLSWKSDNDQVVRANGPSVTGMKLGRGKVTAQYGAVTSDPADVSVVDSIVEGLVVDRDTVQIRVGESLRIGTDLSIVRGGTDFSGQCEVTPALPGVVRYVPETHSLVGVAPGVSTVTFAWGDKLAATTVQVLPIGVIEGVDVVVEPAVMSLSRGQAVDMRVFLITKEGRRIDRTDSAILSSSAPSRAAIRGNRVCAVAPGICEITAQVPDTDVTGKASVIVDDHSVTDLFVEPAQLTMSVGDMARLRILGRSASGTHELFPQPDLTVTAEGQNPQAITIVGAELVDAVTPGSAEVVVTWQPGRLQQRVPASVTDDPLTGLTLHPSGATIHPGQAVVYQVTGVRGGRRRVLGPQDGVSLLVGSPSVARVIGDMIIAGESLGQTPVVAQLGSQRAEAVLNVTPGSGPGAVVSEIPGGIGPDVIYRPGGLVYGPDGIVYGPGGAVYHHGGIVTEVPGQTIVRVPPAGVRALRFIPDVVRLDPDSPGVRVRVVEVLADGTTGRDVTTDPALEFNTPGNVARVDRTEDGAVVRPVGPGETRIAAKLGSVPSEMLFAEPELLVQVGNVPTGLARLSVSPNPLSLWAGEARHFGSVTVAPGPGQVPSEVSYSIGVPPNQQVVTAEPDGQLRGLSPGVVQVVITAVQPGTAYDGLATTATVRVTNPDGLRIDPKDVSLGVGETTPRFTVLAQGADGGQYQVPATLDSMDPNVLKPEGLGSDRFVAASLGGTQVRALYRGREAFATVTVTGKRFLDVNTTLNEGQNDFSVSMEVLADGSEGPLEYRMYAVGQTPQDVWVPAERRGQQRRVLLESSPIPYGPRSARYSLMLEARSPADGSVQRYPFTFRLAPRLERTDRVDSSLPL